MTAISQKEVCPRDEIADPPCTSVFPILREMDFAEAFVYFRTLCGMQLSPLRLARNRALECGPLSGQAREETLCFWCRSELSAQVRQHDSYRSYRQRYDENVPMVPRSKPMSVR